MDKPYKETGSGEKVIREFSPDVPFEDLKWHRDYEDRIVRILEPNDWKYQEDNKLPVPLVGELFIPKGLWHRVIKGTTKLKVEIIKLNTI
jgi:hypothetical protein